MVSVSDSVQNMPPSHVSLDSIFLQVGIITPYLATIMLELMGTPYLGATISLLELLSTEAELVTFGVSSEALLASPAAEELDSGFAVSELVAGPSVAELDSGAAVAELDLGVSIVELDEDVLSSSADVELSQLAQKNAVSESRIFFQCL